jgi:hypothetical protein
MSFKKVFLILLSLARISNAQSPSLRGNVDASVYKGEYLHRPNVNNHNKKRSLFSKLRMNQVRRKLLDDTEPIPVIIYPFRLTIRPTATLLQQFQIDEIGKTIESFVFDKLSKSSDASLSLVRSIQLSGVYSVTFTPSQRIDDWRTIMSSTDLEFKAGVAQTHYSIYHETPTASQLATAMEMIMRQDLISSIRSNVYGLEWIQTIHVEMHMPRSTPSPTALPIQPTASPTKQPTVSPTMEPTTSPTKQPTLSPTERNSLSPSAWPIYSTVAASREPTLFPTFQKYSSSVVPTMELSDEITTVEQKNVSLADNVDSPNNNKNEGNKKNISRLQAPAIWGALSCIIIFVGFAVLRRRKRNALKQYVDQSLFLEKDISYGDGDRSDTPDTMDGHVTSKCIPDCDKTYIIKNFEEQDSDVSLNSSGNGSYVSVPMGTFGDGEQVEGLVLQTFSKSDGMKAQSQKLQELDFASKIQAFDRNHDESLLPLHEMTPCNIPFLDGVFSPCSNVFMVEDATENDQDDKSSVHMNALETSFIFEQFDASKELWDTHEDEHHLHVKNEYEVTNEAESFIQEGRDGTDSEGDVNEFVLDNSWDPDDTDSASESPSFGVPQFEPVYEHDSDNMMNGRNNSLSNHML